MEADKDTENKAANLFLPVYFTALCVVSGLLIGMAIGNLQIGFGIFLGLLAIVSAIFLSQGKL